MTIQHKHPGSKDIFFITDDEIVDELIYSLSPKDTILKLYLFADLQKLFWIRSLNATELWRIVRKSRFAIDKNTFDLYF